MTTTSSESPKRVAKAKRPQRRVLRSKAGKGTVVKVTMKGPRVNVFRRSIFRGLSKEAVAGEVVKKTAPRTYFSFNEVPKLSVQVDATPEPVAVQFELGKKVGPAVLESSIRTIASGSTDVLGGYDKALEWLNTHPIPALSNQTARKLVGDGWGSAVLEYLDELRYGSRG